MKKKGFTLIELLAIIVILAIIALIAVPVVLNIIDKAKVSSYQRSSENVLDAARLYYNEKILDKTTNLTGNVYGEVIKTLSGDTPEEDSQIYINKEGKIAAALKYGNNCYVKNYTQTSFKRTDLTEDGSCVITKCIRATELHTEDCAQTYCKTAGHTGDNATITYGNENTTNGTLTSGDAFDCDVDGKGYNHRFYYVTDFTSNNEEYAVLVYYNNTIEGVADNGSSSVVAYDSSNENWHGPRTAINNLPTIEQWSNISLSTTSRTIKTNVGTTSTGNGNNSLPETFIYEKTNNNGETIDLAARLLTYQEIEKAVKVCGKDKTKALDSNGSLDGCDYLIENTKYSNNSLGSVGYWLETPSAADSSYVWSAVAHRRSVIQGNANLATSGGTRPAIEVLKTEIEY